MAKPSKTDRRILEGATRDTRLRAAPPLPEPEPEAREVGE